MQLGFREPFVFRLFDEGLDGLFGAFLREVDYSSMGSREGESSKDLLTESL